MNSYVYPNEEFKKATMRDAFLEFNFEGSTVQFSLSKIYRFTPLEIKNQVLWAYEEWLRKEEAAKGDSA